MTPNQVWALFDWETEDNERFLSDPEVPAIAEDLGVRAPPLTAVAVAEFNA